MGDHYSILGLTKNATNAEIKTAYRRLVKVYHPDKNPNNPSAVEKFRLIQEAYDTLSDSVKRSKYDNKINYSSYSYGDPFAQTQQAAKNRTKKYTFTDEDLKKRQYYKEHYKQHTTKQGNNSAEQKKVYNEVKYILFSVPVAIALLFFIINIYNRENKEESKRTETNKSAAATVDSALLAKTVIIEPIIKTSDQPYNYLFGEPKIDKSTLQVVQVTNWSGRDAIVCIVDAKTNKPIRNYFIENRFNILYEYLPVGTYYMRNYIGKDFRLTKRQKDHDDINGVFESEQQFQTFPLDTFSISMSRHDTIAKGINFIKKQKNRHNITDAKTFFGL